ncbi:hypothetical protein [Corynebacterium pygosceleis]|uniref:hypothetical protein n=1 Tax=Corynebacterium pygosceleis TaxID=2800406 RepID=UPI002005400D|nr:hypothetical protein [Corynebacterium pygosceleis]MCK7676405.1 hypothetical protein [Corynebacterium pygosceleis]
MTLTPQQARELLADLEKPDHLRDQRSYSYATPTGYHVGFGGQWSYYEAAQHLPELLRFYADNAPEPPEPRTLADLPVEEWPGTRVCDMAGGGEGEVLGDYMGEGLECGIRFDNQPKDIYTWPAEHLTLVDTYGEETRKALAELMALDARLRWEKEIRGTREERLRAEDKVRAKYGLPPRRTDDEEPEDTTDTEPEEDDEAVNTGIVTLADMDVDDCPGWYIDDGSGARVMIIAATKDPDGTYRLQVSRGAITYGMAITAQAAAQTPILGLPGDPDA